jgi:hypothetical protein
MAKPGDKGRDRGAAAKDAAAGPSAVAVWAGRARAIGALIGFAVAFWVSRRAGIGTTDAALRGLLGAVAFSLVTWFAALLVIGGLVRTAATRPAPPEAPAPPAGAGTPVGG